MTTNEILLEYNDRALLDPADYLELRKNNPSAIKEAVIIPPRIGRDTHLGKILVIYSHGRYGTELL